MSNGLPAADIVGSVDFGIISIREDEFRAVLRYFPPIVECRGRRTYDIGEFDALNGSRYRVALVRTSEQGHLAAQSAASDMIADLDPAWMLVVGIAGAVPETEFSLGDVVLATRLHDFSLSAAIPGGRREEDIRGGASHKVIQDLVIRLPVLEAKLAGWNDINRIALPRPKAASADGSVNGDEKWKAKVRQAIEANFGSPEQATRAPRVIAAAMASGNMLLKDPEVLSKWLEDCRSIKAVEMELPGVYEAARGIERDIPVLAIRGISDVIGLSRDPAWTAYACATAASFASSLLGLGLFDPRPKSSPLLERITATVANDVALEEHLQRLRNWSAQIQFTRMPSARDVEEQTIPLSFSGTPRHFRKTARSAAMLSEYQLLEDKGHLLILGPPGAGKTTTVKRLCRILLGAIREGEAGKRTPLLVRLRACNKTNESTQPLLVAIAEELGLNPYITNETVEIREENRPVQLLKRKQAMCSGGKVDRVVPKLLDELHATLFLDGLDEVNPAVRGNVEADISELMAASKYLRVVLTCRTGERLVQLGYITTLEVCDLSDADIADFSRAWLGNNSEKFLESLRSKALVSLARRPLFLAHMLNIFYLGGYLPDQPYEIYELITILSIREWDRERGITRASRYSDFGAEKKLRFLSSLAFELTYVNKLKIFSERDLIVAYKKLRRKFNLPEDEAKAVISEIESHTGIIAEAGFEMYEFSHLTIQEYLAAENLVRSPFPSKKISAYLRQHAEPLAIATALSSDPAQWLAGVLMNPTLIAEVGSKNLITFLARLQLENPIFVAGDSLGMCILGLCFRAADTSSGIDRAVIERHIGDILEYPAARQSFVRVAVGKYSISIRDLTDPFFTAVRRTENIGEEDQTCDMELPDSAKLSKVWMNENFIGRELMYNGIVVTERR